MTLTTLLAAWGATLSTVVAAWNIYKDLVKRDRVSVHAGFKVLHVSGNPSSDVFMIMVTNLSDKVLSVNQVGGYVEFVDRWPWLSRLFRHKTRRAFLLSFNTLYGPLPIKVDARHQGHIVYTIKAADFPDLAHLMVTMSDGREWYAPRGDIRAIQKERRRALLTSRS